MFQTSVWVFEKNVQKRFVYPKIFQKTNRVIYKEKPPSRQNVQLDEVTLNWRFNAQLVPANAGTLTRLVMEQPLWCDDKTDRRHPGRRESSWPAECS